MGKENQFFNAVQNTESKPDKDPVVERYELRMENPEIYSCVIGKHTVMRIMEAAWGGEKPTVTGISTPEAEAISGAGLFIRGINDQRLEFRLPRFHLGVAAQMDMEIAIFHLANTPLMLQIIDDSNHQNSGIIKFTREGHLTQWQKAVWMISGKNLPTTLVKVRHQPADNIFNRTAEVEEAPNLEGFPKRPKRIYLCDPVASGMQQVAMIEKLEELDRLPQQVTVIAPMATEFGLKVIHDVCISKKVKFSAGICGAVLDTRPPLRYYSPYPRNENQVVNTELHRLLTVTLGDRLHDWCIRGNWTGTFLAGPQMPLMDSEKELKPLGLSNKLLMEMCRNLTPEKARAAGCLDSLIPYSTRRELRVKV